jgi:ABC-2 type transport system ATP-binding protein
MVDELLELVDLAEKKNDDVSALSRGMQQRLCLAHALVHDPDILLLDEPASGLDPRARIEMRELLRELQRMGKTVLVSSHILAELAEMCDSIAIVERGRLLAAGSVAEIERQLRPHHVVRVKVLSDREAAMTVLRNLPYVLVPDTVTAPTDARANGSEPSPPLDPLGEWIEIQIDGGEIERAAALTALVASGISVATWAPIERDLEALFMTVTKGEVA